MEYAFILYRPWVHTNPFIACTCKPTEMQQVCKNEFLLCTCILHNGEANGGYSDAVDGMCKIPLPLSVSQGVLHQLTLMMNDLHSYGDYLIFLLHSIFNSFQGTTCGSPAPLQDIM